MEKTSQCLSGKRTFTTERDAQKAAEIGHLERGIVLYHYFCLQCYNYHLTSSKRTTFSKRHNKK